MNDFHVTQINGGVVTPGDSPGFWLPPVSRGYANAQLDDYGRAEGSGDFLWRPGVSLRLQARFSHVNGALRGTAGFGFWNAPFANPRRPRPALPQAAWFFYASPPSDLPLRVSGSGQGWFASTIDAGSKTAVSLIPFAPSFLLLSRVPAFRTRFWPVVRRRLGISFQPVAASMMAWHSYQLDWRADGCRFYVDGKLLLATTFSPRGPLGFVCWLDNQYMALTLNGRFRWNTLPIFETQWLEVADLNLNML